MKGFNYKHCEYKCSYRDDKVVIGAGCPVLEVEVSKVYLDYFIRWNFNDLRNIDIFRVVFREVRGHEHYIGWKCTF